MYGGSSGLARLDAAYPAERSGGASDCHESQLTGVTLIGFDELFGKVSGLLNLLDGSSRSSGAEFFWLAALASCTRSSIGLG